MFSPKPGSFRRGKSSGKRQSSGDDARAPLLASTSSDGGVRLDDFVHERENSSRSLISRRSTGDGGLLPVTAATGGAPGDHPPAAATGASRAAHAHSAMIGLINAVMAAPVMISPSIITFRIALFIIIFILFYLR